MNPLLSLQSNHPQVTNKVPVANIFVPVANHDDLGAANHVKALLQRATPLVRANSRAKQALSYQPKLEKRCAAKEKAVTLASIK